MLPYILAAVGGYLIGDSLKGKQFAEGGYMAKGGVVGTYELIPFISIGNKDYVTPKYDGRIIFEGTKDNAIEKANSMLSNEILRVEVSKVNPKATSVLKRTKKIAEVFEDGGYMEGSGDTSRKGTYTGRIVSTQSGERMIGKISGYRGNGEPVYDVHNFGSLRKDMREKVGELANSKIKELLKARH
jgi:hypothetical protein